MNPWQILGWSLVVLALGVVGVRAVAIDYVYRGLRKGTLGEGRNGTFTSYLDKQGNLFIRFQLVRQDKLEKYWDDIADLKVGDKMPDLPLSFFEKYFGWVEVGSVSYLFLNDEAWGLEGLAKLALNFTEGEDSEDGTLIYVTPEEVEG